MTRGHNLGHVGHVISKLLIFKELKGGQRWPKVVKDGQINHVGHIWPCYLNIYILISYIVRWSRWPKKLSLGLKGKHESSSGGQLICPQRGEWTVGLNNLRIFSPGEQI